VPDVHRAIGLEVVERAPRLTGAQRPRSSGFVVDEADDVLVSLAPLSAWMLLLQKA
jgi:hypothetical protein